MTPPPLAPPASQPLPAGGLVLIVDDDAAVRSTTAALFEQWGLRAVAAPSAAAALAALDEARATPVLLVVDLHLRDGASGLTLIAAIRSRYRQPANLVVPAILVTGDASADQEAQARRSGILLLRKPVDPVELERDARAAVFSGAG